MSISVGDTFELDGDKWAIKLIDLSGKHPNNKTGKPRIDASRFFKDEFGSEKVRKGRPSRFDPEVVFSVMGVKPEVCCDATSNCGLSTETIPLDAAENSWEQARVSESRVAELIGSLDDDSNNDDW